MSFFDDIASMVQQPPTSTTTLSPEQRRAIDLNNADTTLQASGQFIGALSHINFGLQARTAGDFQADQLHQLAGQAMASSQRQAYDVDLQSQYTASAALATAAASGGGASDPTVVNLIAKNAGIGAYKQAVALYEGQDRARMLNLQAEAKQYEGKSTMLNSMEVGLGQALGGATTITRGAAREQSLLKRFGAGGPDSVDF